MRHLFYILFAAVLLSACQKETPGDSPQQGPQPIEFRTFIEEGGEIRPLSGADTRSYSGDPLAKGYYLHALLSTVDYPKAEGTYEQLMRGVLINKDGSYKNTADRNKYFWAEGGLLRHTFIAYSADPSGGDGAGTPNGGTNSQPVIALNYAPDNDPAKQLDLLYADNAKNIQISAGGTVPVVDLVFKHRLSRVMFKLIGTGSVPLTECQAKITYKGNTVRQRVILYLDESTATSFSSSYHSGNFALGASFSLSGSATSAQTAVEMGDMILIPQQLAEGWVTLTLDYKVDGASTVKTVSTEIPALNLKAGNQYDIILNVIEESQNLSVAGVTLGAWNNKTGTIDKP